MIRPLILFLLMVANAACVSYVDDFAYLPVLRAQQGGGEFDVRVGANVAQTIRKNFEWNPTFESVAHRSTALAARLSVHRKFGYRRPFGAGAWAVLRWCTACQKAKTVA